jgi:hypothetical protein
METACQSFIKSILEVLYNHLNAVVIILELSKVYDVANIKFCWLNWKFVE